MQLNDASPSVSLPPFLLSHAAFIPALCAPITSESYISPIKIMSPRVFEGFSTSAVFIACSKNSLHGFILPKSALKLPAWLYPSKISAGPELTEMLSDPKSVKDLHQSFTPETAVG